jgi:arylsulfatase A-like enzyme
MEQLDDYLGRLFQLIEEQGSYDLAIIVFTSDHSDYLGDHRLGKKLFVEQSVKIHLIIRYPTLESS